jgi:hypothetical protein
MRLKLGSYKLKKVSRFYNCVYLHIGKSWKICSVENGDMNKVTKENDNRGK